MEMSLREPDELPDLLKLDKQLCFTIYAASRAIIRAYRPILERFDLTYPQYLVLLTLWERDGILVSDIGKRLYLDSGTLTPLLKRMEQTGYIVRTRDGQDERKVAIWLAERGSELKKEALQIPQELIRETRMESFDTAEIKDMVDRLLLKLMNCPTLSSED